MSTLRVTDIQSNSTAFNTPVRFETSGGTENGQLVKMWVNWKGTGTVAIRNDFNVNSISDRGTGQYTVNFSNALASVNYCVNGVTGTQGCASYMAWGNAATTSVQCQTMTAHVSGSVCGFTGDVGSICMSIFA